MAPEHSDRACTLCRQRRVRCDKTLPACRRCTKFGQSCPGYPSRQRFIDQSDTIRNKLNDEVATSISGQRPSASLDSSPAGATSPNSHAAEHRIFRIQSIPNAVPDRQQARTAVERLSVAATDNFTSFTPPLTSNHTSQQHTPSTSLITNSPPDNFAPDVSMQQLLEDSGSDYFDLDIESYYANGTNACGFFPGIPVSLPSDDGLGVLDGVHDSQLLSPARPTSDSARSPAMSGIRPSEATFSKEMALLVHLFVDFLAPWMDLFDFDAYFSRVLPADAMPSILLQSAVAAVAAKQTARYVMAGCAEPASCHYAYITTNYQDVSSNEWFYKAACYYDRGISHLRAQLQQSSAFSVIGSSPSINTFSSNTPSSDLNQPSAQGNTRQPGGETSEVHCLFSAISVFSLYESLDDCFAASSQHLPGFLALFSRNGAPTIPRSLRAGRAAFWYFARKEALASYAHHTKPRIDPSDASVWVSAGLPAQVFHFFSSQASMSNNPSSLISALVEDRDAAHSVLIWMLAKVVDLVGPNNGRPDVPTSSLQSLPTHHASIMDRSVDEHPQSFGSVWTKLRELLSHWYANRSCLFIPHATIETHNPYGVSIKPLRIAFFASPTSVAALQLYHFIQIILLINQPPSQMDQGSRLRLLKENSIEVEYHSREIYTIASGRQSLAIQRHMAHPLQLAGAYFESKEDRDTISELLREASVETSSPIEVLG